MDAENREPPAGQGIGRRLERAREDRGLSYSEVEERTRIRARYLRDLEREEFDVLPAVYVTGSLKTYADFLGLDGAALSRELKGRLQEPAGPDIPAQIAALEDPEDEGRGPRILPAAGFDQLFLGAGVLLISILAIMTLVAAVAQGDRAPVSEISEPSTPDTPSEIALAADARDEPDPRPAEDAEEARPDRDGQDRTRDSKKAEGGEDRKKGRSAARPDPNRGNTVAVPATAASVASASAEGRSEASVGSASPATEVEDASGPSPAASAAASPPSRGNKTPGPRAGGETRREPRPAFASEVDRVSASVNRAVDKAFAEAGIDR